MTYNAIEKTYGNLKMLRTEGPMGGGTDRPTDTARSRVALLRGSLSINFGHSTRTSDQSVLRKDEGSDQRTVQSLL